MRNRFRYRLSLERPVCGLHLFLCSVAVECAGLPHKKQDVEAPRSSVAIRLRHLRTRPVLLGLSQRYSTNFGTSWQPDSSIT